MPKIRDLLAYSLIEMVIVISLISMLVFTVLPAYQDYKKKTQVANILALAKPCQLAFQEFLIAKNHFPNYCSNKAGGCEIWNTFNDQLNKACFPNVATPELTNWKGYAASDNPPQIEFTFASTFYTEGSPAQPVMFWLAMDNALWQSKQIMSWRCRNVTYGSQIPDKYIPNAFLPCISGA